MLRCELKLIRQLDLNISFKYFCWRIPFYSYEHMTQSAPCMYHMSQSAPCMYHRSQSERLGESDQEDPEETEDGNYTVYGCPGLAPVSNLHVG